MKIELKKISYNKRLSQETSAYAADIWIDGVKRGTVENSGHGGPDNVQPHELNKQLNEYAKTLPQEDCFGTMMTPSVEMILGQLLDKHLFTTDLKRAMKGKILFTIAGDKRVWSVKGTLPPKDAVKVLNHLPFDEAYSIYRNSNSP